MFIYDLTVDGTPVFIHDNNAIAANGPVGITRGAFVPLLAAAGMSFVEGNEESLKKHEYFIMMHQDFLRLDPQTVQAVIWHELGHRVNGDMSNSNIALGVVDRLLGKVFKSLPANYFSRGGVQSEIEADAYAAKHVGKAVMRKALKDAIAFMSAKAYPNSKDLQRRMYEFGLDMPDVKARLKALA